MKKIYLLLLPCLFCSLFSFNRASKKIALIIAIGEYPNGGRWRNLSSLNDLYYVKASLIKAGFNATEIDTLTNAQATKKNMVKALDDLYNRVEEGDVVYFQFSGHGQQIQDDNGDELDGYDEALIPYDAGAAYDPVSYKGENHFRDDLLGEKLNAIRKKIGAKGSLVVLIDACHSGTATRDIGIKRGIETPFQAPGYKPKSSIDLQKNPEKGLLEGFTEGMGSMVVFSACSPNQPNYEMKDADKKGVGSLSYAFAKSLADLGAESNYYILFQKMKAFIQGDIATQIPMAEGDLQLEVFGGKYIPKPTIIEVQQRFNHAGKGFNDTTFLINQGELNNVKRGTTLKVYKTGTTEWITDAVVISTSSFQSICVSSKPLNKNESYEAKLDATNAGDFSASLFIRMSDTKDKQAVNLANQIKSFAQPLQYLSFNNDADYVLDIQSTKGNYAISLITKGDSVRYVRSIAQGKNLDADDWKFLLDGIKRSMRARYLRNLPDAGSLSKDIKIEIVPQKPNVNQNELVMQADDAFEIKITNNGSVDYYYTIIDLMPDNDMKVLLPSETDEPQDFVIHPNQTITIGQGFQITVDKGTSNGKELFKLIVSKTPMDLRGVVNRQKTRSAAAGQVKSIEAMMDDLYKDSNDSRSTRSSIGAVKVDEVGVVTCGFTIRN